MNQFFVCLIKIAIESKLFVFSYILYLSCDQTYIFYMILIEIKNAENI